MGKLFLSQVPSPPVDLLDKGELGLLIYFILALISMILAGLGGMWILLEKRDRRHEQHLSNILRSQAEERKLLHESSQVAIKDLRQDIRMTSSRLDKLNTSIFDLVRELKTEGEE